MLPVNPDTFAPSITTAIVLANEPLAYRQALARVFQTQRPHLHVVTVEPADLDAAVQEHAPLLVICDRLTLLVETCVAAWVLLYPGGARLVTQRLAGTDQDTDDLDLATLLAFTDLAARRALL